MQYISFLILARRLKAIISLLKDPKVSFLKKALVFAGIAYLILPIDFIPVFVFPFAIIDDIVLWVFILWVLKDELDKYADTKPEEDISKKFNKDNIIEDVDFEVNGKDSEGSET